MLNWKRVASVSLFTLIAGTAFASDPESCQTVRIADGGWTDNVAQNGLATVMLEPLGYSVHLEMLSAPMIFASLKNNDVDVFLNSWSPSVDTLVKPYIDDGSVIRLIDNMTGAKWTLAVPDYVWDGGLKTFADIATHRDKLGDKIYGIEPGSDGNQIILDMIEQDAFGLSGFELIESSEQAMLTQVERSVRTNEWVVFMGWAPHPMNNRIEMRYLDGGDDWFGPDQGGATIWTAVRDGFVEECPNLGRFFANLKFTVELENTMMGYILEDDMDGEEAAKKYIGLHPELLDGWLDGVKTVNGDDALPTVRENLGLQSD